MQSLRKVSRLEKIAFSILVTMVCVLLVLMRSSIVMLMLGNVLRECGVTQRLLQAAQNEIINVVTIFLGVSVGITMRGGSFLQLETLKIIVLGVIAFISTAGGILMAKLMNVLSRRKPINPLIGAAGVSPCLWRLVWRTPKDRNTILATTCSCMRWGPTSPA